ncbi:glutathione S-transferase, partial [Stenotrophomonas sp. MB339]
MRNVHRCGLQDAIQAASGAMSTPARLPNPPPPGLNRNPAMTPILFSGVPPPRSLPPTTRLRWRCSS